MTPLRRLALASVAILPMLAGCASLRIPVEQRGVVMLLGLDAAPGRGYTVTMSYLNPLGTASVGQRSGAGQASPALIRTATAATLPQAIAQVSEYSYQYFDFSHISGVLVSAPLASQGLATVLDTFQRAAIFAGFLYVGVVRTGTAHQVLLATRASLPSAGFVFTKTIQWARLNTPFAAERMPEFLDRMEMAGEEPITAAVAAQAPEVGSPAFALDGLAVFRGDRLRGWLQGQQALGWDLLSRHCFLQPVAVGTAEPFTLVLRGCSVAVRLLPGGGLHFQVHVHVAGHLLSVADPTASFTRGPSPFAPFEAAADRMFAQAAEAAIHQGQALGADPFGFGQQVRIQDPALWRALRDQWSSRWLPRATFDVSVQTSVDLPGLTVLPLQPGG